VTNVRPPWLGRGAAGRIPEQGGSSAVKIEDIRRTIVIALVSDDELMNTLVLKGGNALALVHKIGTRSSLDLDFSMESDFSDPERVKTRMQRALEREFRTLEIEVFDFQWKPMPSSKHPSTPAWWGGYQVEFKLTPAKLATITKGIQHKRATALTVDPGSQSRTFAIDISKYEYIAPKVAAELDHYTVFVYPPKLIVLEKLRAICQQMPEYSHLPPRQKRPRPRDFFDIHSIATTEEIDLAEAKDAATLKLVFKAKEVALELLDKIKVRETYQFHDEGWQSVIVSAKPQQEFRFYFEFVCNLVSRYNHRG
jgi:predicted nucleotidyltransferase component of viral defense system